MSRIPRVILSAYLRSYVRRDGAADYAVHAAAGPVLQGNEYFLWSEPTGEDAFSCTWQGDTYVCPRNPRLRMLEGLLAFNNAFPDAGLIPAAELVTANDELSRLRNQTPPLRSHILTSPWHVPIRWFAAFLHEEKELYERGAGLSIRY